MTTRLQTAACGTMIQATGFSPLDENHRPLVLFTATAMRLFSVLLAWNQRARQRRALSRLDDRLLADIGVSRAAAAHEAAKRPWED